MVDDVGLLTVEEAAEALRLSPSAIYARVRSGELRALRVGEGPKAPIRIETETLAEYVLRSSAKRTA